MDLDSKIPPLLALRNCCANKETGELVFVADVGELHVYIQAGRIAWATDSNARFAFSRHIVEQCDIDKATFKELIRDCQRLKKPLGEMLIQWEVATAAQVRDALQLQISAALRTLGGVRTAEMILLKHSFRQHDYDPNFTFDFSDVRPMGAHFTSLPPAKQCSKKDTLRAGEEFVQHVATMVPDAHWVALMEKERLLCSAKGRSRPGTLPETLVQELFMPFGVDFVGVRSGLDTVFGFMLVQPEYQSLWCGFGALTTYGGGFTTLNNLLTAHGVLRQPKMDEQIAFGQIAFTGSVPTQTHEVLADLLERPEFVGVFVFNRTVLEGGVHREHVSIREIEELANCIGEIGNARPSQLGSVEDESASAVRALGLDDWSLVLGRGQLWYFGSHKLDSTGRMLWLCLDRRCAQGIGWALMASLTRR